MKLFCLYLVLSMLMFISCEKENTPNDENNSYKLAPREIDQQLFVNLVNQARKNGCKCGDIYYPSVSPVVWSDVIKLAAQAHSDDMNKNNYFDHTGIDGTNLGDRLIKFGYNWICYGENIAKGIPSEKEVVDAWLASPTHCKTIMNPNFQEIGSATSGIYWTLDFATKCQ